MKLAMTIRENRISPVADWALDLLMAGIVNRSVQGLALSDPTPIIFIPIAMSKG
jgi:hypothetical protein